MLNILIAIHKPPQHLLDMLDGHEVAVTQKGALQEELISKGNYDVIFLDGDTKSIKQIKNLDPRAEVIFFGESDAEGLSAIQNGAFGFYKKASIPEHLLDAINAINELSKERREVADLEKKLFNKYTFHGLTGKNPKILDIQSIIRRIAPYYKTVLITGETGTGKEVVAKALHAASPFARKNFIACNCGSLMENLIESELFGHTKGAFTGAISENKGLFEAAGEGALFLDEIGEIPLSFQTHFLRVLQSGEFRNVGSEQKRFARCRIIAATNKDLATEVQHGSFREDLFYRISQFVIYVPPLRERKEDIPLLSRFLLDRFSSKTGKKVFGISRPVQKAFLDYNWPGNVRELENVIEHAAIMTTESFIRPQDLPEQIQEHPAHSSNTHSFNLDDVVRKHVRHVMEMCAGNQSSAARKLGISRRALIRKLEKFKMK